MSRFIPTLSLAIVPLVGLSFAQRASAHIELTNPPARLPGSSTMSELKIGPCGQATNGRTETVTEYAPGETITIEFDEYFNHTGYFRVAFDIDGDDDFPVRADMDSVDPETDDPTAVNPVGDVVLAYIEDNPAGGNYSFDVTLPNVECENCTLQLIQFMYDKVGNQTDDEYYYQCADIALRGEVTAGAGGTDGGGTGGADAGSGGESATGGDSAAGGDTAVGIGGEMAVGGGDAAGGAATGGATADAGGSPGLVASGGVLAGDGGTAAGGAYPEGMDPAAMDGDSADEGGCSFRASGKMSPFTGLLLLLGLAGFARRRMRV